MSDKETYDWNEVYEAIKDGKFGQDMAEMFESPKDRKKRFEEILNNPNLPTVNFEIVK